jgi:Tfp pilus assembly protein FimV
LIAKHIKFLLICFVTLFSINAHSLQLGKIIFKSNQNSPLDVSIQVNLSSEDKIDQLKPSIAPKENYDSQGIERTKIHNDIVLSLTSQKKK